MKHLYGLFGILLIALLTSCAPDFSDPNEIIDETLPEDIGQETAIIPNYSVSESEYQVLLPYRVSQSRGVTTNQVANRLDITVLENDLRRHSTSVFDPDTYFFQEGQQISYSELFSWLERESDSSEEGLNPPIDIDKNTSTEESIEKERENPKYLSHILEQNYLTRSDDNVVQLAGISIGIAMKSNYRFQTEVGGPFYYENISKKEMLSEAKPIAEEVVKRIRAKDGLQDIPIMVAIYREAARDGLVPGNFVAKTTIQGGSQEIGNWESIDEKYVLFPSNSAQDIDPNLSSTVEEFKSEVANYFPNYVGVIGQGFYQDGEIRSLVLEIPIEFYGQAEVIGFTQYVYGLVMDSFQPHYDIEVNIKSNDRQESLIVRKAGDEEPYVHVYQR
ncbi:CamS family sex pheromone protein [Amphibacillus sp. MSJ-3]|uniref:CamS family sex pheromone protein n=1 Tax=Amphibacillus sp. MSJ-3 TaxID=2841505 RepID=UPI001C0EA9F0|nr:CamS family sex pheromone protein [Amphibacillus sp. MSJ-3]MBU5593895.1 CamS family sex pheromone protein [Amphibacillus sp. MSJ-3]